MRVGLWARAVLIVAGMLPAWARGQDAGSRPYLRVTEDRDGDVARLEVAAREFVHDDPACPRVWLTGAVHIADRSFYDALQHLLDEKDAVLYEQVKPAGSGAEEHDGDLDDAARVRKTERRLRFLAVASEKARADAGVLAGSLDELARLSEPRIASLVRLAGVDAWGRPIEFVPDPPEHAGRRRVPTDFVSLGADGEPGGEGAAADLFFSSQKPLTREERGEGEGIQKQLADAFGLVFQLDAMDHDKPRWRNSDLSIDQVQRRLEAAGADGGMLFSVLDGSSLMGKVAGAAIRLVAAMPQGRVMFKLMLVEMLARADEVLGAAPGGMGALMDVILLERNAVVIEDLTRVLEREPDVRTVGIIYGAGHLPDLERRLVEMGYRPAGDTWLAAITVTPEGEGVPAGSIRQVRPMIRSTIDSQLRQMRRMMERPNRRR